MLMDQSSRDDTLVGVGPPEATPAGAVSLQSSRDKRAKRSAGASSMEEEGRAISAQAYVDDMVRRRGYVLDYHKVMAKQDLAFMKAADGIVQAAYLAERTLDRRTKELIFVVSLTVLRAAKEHIASHMRVALDLGVTPRELLEAIEIAFPEAGAVAFQWGFDVWREMVGAGGIEPSADVAAEPGP